MLYGFPILNEIMHPSDEILEPRRSLRAVWALRSELDLIGNTLDVKTRAWTNTNAGIGIRIENNLPSIYLTSSQ